jgi:L-rhamnose mutarotase
MMRVCFTFNVRKDMLGEYRRRHAEVWPEMRDALTAAGWRDYSLFLRGDGLLIGYLVTEDFEAAKAAMQGLEVNERWQEEMAVFFEGLDVHADEGMQAIEEVFHLD